MSKKEIIQTDKAPAAIGAYSQAVKTSDMLFVSGQIPLDPVNMDVVEGDFERRAKQVFSNVNAVCEAAGTDLNQVVKLTVFLTDLDNFATVNEVMAAFFTTPYPARSAVQVSALPKGVDIEVDAIVQL